MNEQFAHSFYSAERGERAQTPPPRPAPHSPLENEEIDSLFVH